MKQDEIEKLFEPMLERIAETVFCRLQDRSDRSASHTVSKLFTDVTRKLDNHIKITEERWERIEPYITRAEDDRRFKEALQEKGVTFGKWGGIWLTFVGIVASIYYGIKHIK